MPRYEVNTTDTYTKLVCNTSSELIGNYPSITFRIHYNFRIKFTGYGGSWYYNGFKFNFHTKSHTINLNISGGGGWESPVLASGYIDLGISGQTTTHKPGFSCSGPFSGSGTATEKQTIDTGSMSANLVSYGHDSAVINIALNSPRNYWYGRIYNSTDGKWQISEAVNGHNTITGLSPGKSYRFNVEMWSRSGATYTSQVVVTFMTNGFSYLDGNVQNTIGNAITFPIRTYNDNFTTRVKITYDNEIIICEIDVKSTGKVFNFSYTPIATQVSTMYARIPNELGTSGTITLTTYVNGVSIGSKTYSISYYINQTANVPIITSFDYVDTVQKAIDKTGNNKWVLQNVSKLQIKDIVASAKNSATIKTYRVSIGNNTVNASTYPILVNAIVESNSGIYLTVIDSRGLQSTKLMGFIKYFSYAKPYFNELKLTRVNDVEEQSSLSVKGIFDRLPIDSVDKNIALTMKYRYRASDSSVWSTYTNKELIITNNQFSYVNVIGNFDSGVSYVFEIIVSDYFTTISKEDMLIKGTFEFFIGDGFSEFNGILDLTNTKIRIGNNVFNASSLLYDE